MLSTVKNIWIVLQTLLLATALLEGRVYNGDLWIKWISDTTCANAKRERESSLVVHLHRMAIYDKNTMEFVETYQSTTYNHPDLQGGMYYYDSRSVGWTASTWNVTYDSDKQGIMHCTVYMRIGADRVNDNPLAFHVEAYQDIVSKHGLKMTGTGFDFSEMYYKSPVRPFVEVEIGEFNWYASSTHIFIDQSGRPADAGLPDFSLCSLRSHDFTSHPS
ncbi:hypothetical protein Y032_0005g2596 [Ancylostoma ceylanicum]|uniref:Uncharacterized protein n=1 Tax=Ancylostoma ceylanicum TaxID=53326 RepID=A0A016VRY8_9BILA|nr:hypothetical protein Y032_0005g2596 [Ancylostoma ceylanicum]